MVRRGECGSASTPFVGDDDFSVLLGRCNHIYSCVYVVRCFMPCGSSPFFVMSYGNVFVEHLRSLLCGFVKTLGGYIKKNIG